jgi:hypothetical protein
VVHAHFGQVDHDALAFPRRQDELQRQHQFGARARHPRVDTGVGGDELTEADTVGFRVGIDGVLVVGHLDRHDFADDVLAGRGHAQRQRSRVQRAESTEKQ